MHRTEKIKERVPAQLNKKNLQVNKSKTEEYTIKRNGQTKWKRFKYLNSLLDTEEDIKRRKALAIVTYNKLKNILENKSRSMKTKVKILKVYIESVFLYSELWTLIKQFVKEIQRGVIKKIFNIHWQDKITNVELYRRYKFKPWSEVIKECSMKWYGHLLRLNKKTPARLALKEAERKVREPKGGQNISFWNKSK